MILYLLDTNVLIDLAGKRETASFFDQLLKKGNLRLASSILCIAEYMAGASKKEEFFLKEWMDSEELEILYLDSLEVALQAAELRKRQSLLLPDALILATALYWKAHLITHDQELFEKAENLLDVSDPFKRI